MKSVLSALLVLVSICQIKAQSNSTHYYVVVGAFNKIDNAIHYTDQANKQNFSSHYAINSDKNIYYVYLLDSDNKSNALSFLKKIKAETSFADAWLFIGQLGSGQQSVVKEAEPIKEQVVSEPIAEPVKEEVIKEPEVIQPEVKQEPVIVEPKPEGKPFYFKMTSSTSGKEVNGQINIAFSKSSKTPQSFPANKIVYLPKPKNGVIQLVTASTGYKEMKRSINYDNPGASASEIGSEQEAIIALPLIGVRPGDFIEFSNVHFFPNSAIMQPESKNELDGLIELLKGEKFKIKIHGHTNSDKTIEIVTMGNSNEFFALDEASNLKQKTSPKKLTELRAQVVSDYFVSQGIERERISIKGDGTQQRMVPAKSPLASQNDRVEIEIKKGK
jgi:outer membrane protein OmpA-like peptidoglycan-associated protein